MTQIAQADGLFLSQVKENQPKLLEHCRALAGQPSLAETIGHDCGHGLITTRIANLHNVLLSDIDNRWQQSGLRTFVVMNRETFTQSNQQTTNETSYYLSNYQDDNKQHAVKSLASAIRGHWSVESNNYYQGRRFLRNEFILRTPPQIIWLKMGNQSKSATIKTLLDNRHAIEQALLQNDKAYIEIL